MCLKRKAASSAKAASVGVQSSCAVEPLDRVPDAGNVVRERLDGTAVEELALDRAALGCVPLSPVETVELRSEELLEGRRDRGIRLVDEHRRQLFDEERIPPCGRADAVARSVGDAELRHEHVDVPLGERVEADDRPWPVGTALQQLRPREPDEQDPPVGVPSVLEEIEQHVLRPVEIVDHDEHGRGFREPLQDPSGGPRDRLGRGRPVSEPESQLKRARDRRLAGEARDPFAGLATDVSSWIPAAVRRISANGQYVIPSP